jgi:hypothetical protein
VKFHNSLSSRNQTVPCGQTKTDRQIDRQTDRQTDRPTDMRKLIATFHSRFVIVPKKLGRRMRSRRIKPEICTK